MTVNFNNFVDWRVDAKSNQANLILFEAYCRTCDQHWGGTEGLFVSIMKRQTARFGSNGLAVDVTDLKHWLALIEPYRRMCEQGGDIGKALKAKSNEEVGFHYFFNIPLYLL